MPRDTCAAVRVKLKWQDDAAYTEDSLEDALAAAAGSHEEVLTVMVSKRRGGSALAEIWHREAALEICLAAAAGKLGRLGNPVKATLLREENSAAAAPPQPMPSFVSEDDVLARMFAAGQRQNEANDT